LPPFPIGYVNVVVELLAGNVNAKGPLMYDEEEAPLIVAALPNVSVPDVVLMVPLVNVSVPLNAKPVCNAIPLLLFTVRFVKAVTLVGTNTLADEPPNTRLEEAVVVRLDGVPVIEGPLSVNVMLPIAKVP